MHYVWDRGSSEDIKTVSDYVTPKKIESWKPGDVVVISAPTGSGKSYFVKNTLRDYLITNGLKCLYLLPRTRIKNQFQQELPGDDVITFAMYQTVDTTEKFQGSSFCSKYDVIVADECHYFFSDADYNHGTDLSFEWIMKQQNAIRIFMSATCDLLIESLDDWGIRYIGYVMDRDSTQISSLSFFWNEAQLDKLAERIINNGEKGIFFIQSAEKARDLYLKYKNKGMFLCSMHNPKKLYKYIDKELVNDLLQNERFDCQLLIATMALDAGVTLKDKGITAIVTDVVDPVSIVQCVGRKRFIDKNDKLNVYVLAQTNQQINGMLRKQRERLKIVHDFLKLGPTEYNARYERSNDADHLIYDAPVTVEGKTTFVKRVNWLKHRKIKYDIRVYEQMLRVKDGYIPYVAKMLGCKEYSIMEVDQRMQSLTEYLDSIADKPMLTKSERKPLIEMLDIRHNGKLLSTCTVLAAWLEQSRLPYRLHEYRTNRTVDGERKSYHAWKVVRLES